MLVLQELDPDRKAIFAEFPHGTYPMGPLLAGTLIPTMFKGRKIYSVAASTLFFVPGLRHMMTWLGSQPADRKVFQSLIDKGSVAVVVGGIAEMFMQYDDKEQVRVVVTSQFCSCKSSMPIPITIIIIRGFG